MCPRTPRELRRGALIVALCAVAACSTAGGGGDASSPTPDPSSPAAATSDGTSVADETVTLSEGIPDEVGDVQLILPSVSDDDVQVLLAPFDDDADVETRTLAVGESVTAHGVTVTLERVSPPEAVVRVTTDASQS